MSGTLEFDIRDYWHTGAGHGSGRAVDDSVVRTRAGLPKVPGRTIKGLFRDAVAQCEELDQLPAGTTRRLFGSALGTDRFQTEAGVLAFGSATLSEEWEDYAQTKRGQRLMAGFFEELASTAVDSDGQAVEGTLRSIEVAVPLTLNATWKTRRGGDVSAARRALETAAPLIRRLGKNRYRGLGRVCVSVH